MFSIIFGFVGDDGSFAVLLQPFEFLIIVGSAVGIFIITNPKPLLKLVGRNLLKIKAHYPYDQQYYTELSLLLFNFLKFVNGSTVLQVERHIEVPEESELFSEYPGIVKNRDLIYFICDNYRMILLGMRNQYEIENMLEAQIYERRTTNSELSYALHRIADALPALGIIAAVLGVINAMSNINNPDLLGQKIAAALIGTFLGVMLSYCIVSPIAGLVEKYNNDEVRLMECAKAAITAYTKGFAPLVCIEFVRQAIPANLKPSFIDLETAIENAKEK